MNNTLRKLSNQWETPQWLFDELDKEFNFVLDACAEEHNKKCEAYCKDALKEDWVDTAIEDIGDMFYEKALESYHYDDTDTINEYCQERVLEECAIFCNPPFSDIKPFLEKAIEASHEMTVVMLVKDILSTKAFELIWDYKKHQPKQGVEIRYFPKRINYELNGEEVKGCAFASMLIILRNVK